MSVTTTNSQGKGLEPRPPRCRECDQPSEVLVNWLCDACYAAADQRAEAFFARQDAEELANLRGVEAAHAAQAQAVKAKQRKDRQQSKKAPPATAAPLKVEAQGIGGRPGL